MSRLGFVSHSRNSVLVQEIDVIRSVDFILTYEYISAKEKEKKIGSYLLQTF